MSAPTGFIAAGRLQSSSVAVDYSRAATVTASAMRCNGVGSSDRAHHRLARLHRKLGSNYDGPDGMPPAKPKWMRWPTYSRLALQIRAGEEHLNQVYMLGTLRLLGRLDKMENRRRKRR